jgi:hypothetical protein
VDSLVDEALAWYGRFFEFELGGVRVAHRRPSPNEKNPAIYRPLQKWRDPGSNREHHDFQSRAKT